MSQRFEMRLSDELAGRIDGARGGLPRATWIKRALESALGSSGAALPEGPPPSASSRAPVEKEQEPGASNARSGDASRAGSPAPFRRAPNPRQAELNKAKGLK